MPLKEYKDMLGRTISLPETPERIISLVPSQTEFLYELGLSGRIAGQTVFCIHPDEYFTDAVKVGGTKKIKLDLIRSISPDLIICNKEENTEEIVNTLSAHFPVWVSDIKTLEDACDMMLKLGEVTGRKEKAASIVKEVRSNFTDHAFPVKRTCIYLIWKGPYMAAGRDTFINEMLNYAGFSNQMPNGSRYPELEIAEIIALAPEVLLLSSEPYPFREKHVAELSSMLPSTKILLVDGEFFSWYGSRLLNSRTYFNRLQATLQQEQ
jgi:ABC-type Fe3+-hydroxamate transport system substrate-binding protein